MGVLADVLLRKHGFVRTRYGRTPGLVDSSNRTASLCIGLMAVAGLLLTPHVPSATGYTGTTSPGHGSVVLAVEGNRIVAGRVEHWYANCKPRGRMWLERELEFSSLPKTIPIRNGRFAASGSKKGRGYYARERLAGRMTANGQYMSGTWRIAYSAADSRGFFDCKDTVIRFRAWLSERAFTGTTSQGLPVKFRLEWSDWPWWGETKKRGKIYGYLEGDMTVQASCPDGSVETSNVQFGHVPSDPRTGRFTLLPSVGGAGGSGQVPPLATIGPSQITGTYADEYWKSVPYSDTYPSGIMVCSVGPFTFLATSP